MTRSSIPSPCWQPLCLALAAALASSAAPALAQQPSGAVLIQGFDVSGDNPLGAERANLSLAPFLRQPATLENLQKATSALEKALEVDGHGLHRVVLPPQEIGGVVRLQVVAFSVGKVEVVGAEHHGADNIRRSLPELQEGGAPNFRVLAVQTAIANENPDKNVQVAFRAAPEADKINAQVNVRDNRPLRLSTGLSNIGTPATGRDRFTVALAHSNVFDRDHQFAGAYTTSLARPSDVQQVGLSYRIPSYGLRGVTGLSYTHSNVAGNFGGFTSTGAGSVFGASHTHYFVSQGGWRHYGTVAFDDKLFNVTEIDGVPLPGQLRRRSRPLTLGYGARWETDDAVLLYNVDLAANVGGGGGNNLVAYQTEDPRITTSRWRALRAGASYLSRIGGQWQLLARAQMQASPNALISGEQFGVGGAASVRGMAERALSSDRGVFGSVELRTPELTSGLRGVVFVDAARMTNRGPVTAIKPGSDSVASTGLGLRYDKGSLSIQADYAHVFDGSVVPTTVNSLAPQKGDGKFHVALFWRFY